MAWQKQGVGMGVLFYSRVDSHRSPGPVLVEPLVATPCPWALLLIFEGGAGRDGLKVHGRPGFKFGDSEVGTFPLGALGPGPFHSERPQPVSRGLCERRSSWLTRSVVPLCGIDAAITKSGIVHSDCGHHGDE